MGILLTASSLDQALLDQANRRHQRDFATSDAETGLYRYAYARPLLGRSAARQVTVVVVHAPEGARLDWPGVRSVPKAGSVLASEELLALGTASVADLLNVADTNAVSPLPRDLHVTSDELAAVTFYPLETAPGLARPFEPGFSSDASTLERPSRVLIPAAVTVLLPVVALLTAGVFQFVTMNERYLAMARMQGLTPFDIRVLLILVSTFCTSLAFTAIITLLWLLARLDLPVEILGLSVETSSLSIDWLSIVILYMAALTLASSQAMIVSRNSIEKPLNTYKSVSRNRSRKSFFVLFCVVGSSIYFGLSYHDFTESISSDSVLLAILAITVIGGVSLSLSLASLLLQVSSVAARRSLSVGDHHQTLSDRVRSEFRSLLQPISVGSFLAGVSLAILATLVVQEEVPDLTLLDVNPSTSAAAVELDGVERWALIQEVDEAIPGTDISSTLYIGGDCSDFLRMHAISEPREGCANETILVPRTACTACQEGQFLSTKASNDVPMKVVFYDPPTRFDGTAISSIRPVEMTDVVSSRAIFDLDWTSPPLDVGDRARRQLGGSFVEFTGQLQFETEEQLEWVTALFSLAILAALAMTIVAYGLSAITLTEKLRVRFNMARIMGTSPAQLAGIVGHGVVMPMMTALFIPLSVGSVYGKWIRDGSIAAGWIARPDIRALAVAIAVLVLTSLMMVGQMVIGRPTPIRNLD